MGSRDVVNNTILVEQSKGDQGVGKYENKFLCFISNR